MGVPHGYHYDAAMAESVENPFMVLGLAPAFDLEPAAIDRAYRARASKAHPDLGEPSGPEGAGAGEQDVTIEALNRARSVLIDPEHRAAALVLALGGPAASAEKGLPDGFLMEIMETRMEIEGAAGDPEETAKWEQWAEDEREAYIARVNARFATHRETGDPSVLVEIRRTLNAWRYIERLIEQLDPDYDPAHADFNH